MKNGKLPGYRRGKFEEEGEKKGLKRLWQRLNCGSLFPPEAVFKRRQRVRAYAKQILRSNLLFDDEGVSVSISSTSSINSDITSLARPIFNSGYESDGQSVATIDEDEQIPRKRAMSLERLFSTDKIVREKRRGKDRSDLGSDLIDSVSNLDESINSAQSTPSTLVITGSALFDISEDARLEEMFVAVASCFDSVIAARISPKQKAVLLKLVQKYPAGIRKKVVTLAVGDG